MSQSVYNMVSTLKNGQISRKKSVLIKKTKLCESILKILWDEGYISGYSDSLEYPGVYSVFLKYTKIGSPAIKAINAFSRPGKRIYYSKKQVWKLESSHLFIIFSTNLGVRTLLECKKLNVGGEPLFIIK